MLNTPRSLAAAALAALATLSACNEPETIEGGIPDTQAAELAKAKPVELPPSITASRAYRCKDNSLVYIDFYTNNTAKVSKEKGGDGTVLTAPAAGEPYAAEGYSLSGNGTEVTYAAPGADAQSCKA